MLSMPLSTPFFRRFASSKAYSILIHSYNNATAVCSHRRRQKRVEFAVYLTFFAAGAREAHTLQTSEISNQTNTYSMSVTRHRRTRSLTNSFRNPIDGSLGVVGDAVLQLSLTGHLRYLRPWAEQEWYSLGGHFECSAVHNQPVRLSAIHSKSEISSHSHIPSISTLKTAINGN